MKKICFVDRDGTLLREPPETRQINSFEEMVLIPKVISSLKRLAENGWEFVMVTNQDGLGTPRNPRENYERINQKLFEILRSEDILFLQLFEDDSCEEAPSNNRKPNTGMVDPFLRENCIDYEQSFMVGDRETDKFFAENIGIRGFLLGEWNWESIADEMINQPRRKTLQRKTKETDITVALTLDGTGKTEINTGIGFFDHLLDQVGKHGGFDLQIKCCGDLNVDEHHTIEDTGLLLGEAFRKALGDKQGIERYANEKSIVMDESTCDISLDISGRPYLALQAHFTREYVGDFPTEMVEHFFSSFVQKAEITLHMTLTGKNNHHLLEVAFKALARALREAVKRTSKTLPSTKGSL